MRQSLVLLWLFFFTTGCWAKPWVVAHRGGPAGGGEENRLATFQDAIKLGVDGIELDIHQTLDGHLVVIHDITLARTFNGRSGRVNEMTLAEVQEVGLPTLEQALELVRGRCRLLIEVKQPKGERHRGIERRLVNLLREGHLISKKDEVGRSEVVVISFDPETLRRIHALEPNLATGYLTKLPIPAVQAGEIGATYLLPYYLLVDSEYVRAAHEAGFKVGVWTVDDPAAMQSMIEAGCDAIITNDPSTLLRMRDEIGPREDVRATPLSR